MSEILDLSTKKDRSQIRIDDVLYNLLLPTDLELRDMLWLQKIAKRIDYLQKLLKNDDVPDAVGDEFEAIMSRFSGLILGEVPKKVLDLLTDVQRMAVVDVYAELMETEQKRFFEERAGQTGEEEVGSTSSPSSNDSTKETSRAG